LRTAISGVVFFPRTFAINEERAAGNCSDLSKNDRSSFGAEILMG
jgi:hypothetical protein